MSKSPKQTELPSDGERMVPEHHKGMAAYGDHIVRYSSVTSLVKGKTVLDIASGSGYGAKMLASGAKKVYGVDIEKDAIEYAKKNYQVANVEFKVGSGTEIPLEDNSVDVVVSFETIEHIDDSAKFVEEVHRVLKPDGIAIISTPNDLEFPEGNHYHVHEYTYEELVGLVSKHFKYVDSYYQGTWYYTAVSPSEMIFKEWDKDIRVINAAPLPAEKVLFFMLVCSNKPIKQKVDAVGSMAQHTSAKSIQEKEILTAQHIANITEQLEAAKAFVAEQNRVIEDLQQAVEQHAAHESTVRKVIKSVKHRNNQ